MGASAELFLASPCNYSERILHTRLNDLFVLNFDGDVIFCLSAGVNSSGKTGIKLVE